MIKLGLDLDNTVIIYNKLFYNLALEKGLIDKNIEANKTSVRNHLRSIGADHEFTLPLEFGKLIAVENTSEGVPVPAIPTTFQDRHDSIRIDKRFLANGVTYTGGYYLKHDFDSSLWKICFTSPDSGYTATITYNSDLPDLAGGSTVSKIPSTFHDLICLFAAMRGYAIEQQKFPEGLETLRQEQLLQLRNYVETFGRHGPGYVNVQE